VTEGTIDEGTPAAEAE
jgi:hypothetical protein